MSDEVYDYLMGLDGPTGEELAAIEAELGWIDLVESLIEDSPVIGSTVGMGEVS